MLFDIITFKRILFLSLNLVKIDKQCPLLCRSSKSYPYSRSAECILYFWSRSITGKRMIFPYPTKSFLRLLPTVYLLSVGYVKHTSNASTVCFYLKWSLLCPCLWSDNEKWPSRFVELRGQVFAAQDWSHLRLGTREQLIQYFSYGSTFKLPYVLLEL